MGENNVIVKDMSRDFNGFKSFQHPKYAKVVFGMLSVHVCVPTFRRLVGLCLYSVFQVSSALGDCPVNMNILASKIGALQMDVNKMAIVFKTAWISLIKFHYLVVRVSGYGSRGPGFDSRCLQIF
jgi:hypothetical protein